MISVKLEDARRVISAAEKKAMEIGQPMNIAVADEGGCCLLSLAVAVFEFATAPTGTRSIAISALHRG
jgi:uncharacterized protein GlcG (DUF336 family)